MIICNLLSVNQNDIGADDRQGTRRVLRQGRRAKPGHLPAGRDTAAEVLEEKRRHQVLQQVGLQALQVKVHHVQVQGGGLLEGLSDQESRREERRRQARRQRPAIEVGDRKESGRPVQAPHGREEDGQPQMPFGTSVRNHQADNRRGLLPAAQDVQDRGRDGPVLPCVQHAEGNEYADDGRAGGRDGRMMVRKPRSRARRHCRTDSTRRESRIWKPQLYYDNPPDIAMSGTLKATFKTVWGRV